MPNMAQYIKESPYANETHHSYARLYKNITKLNVSDFTPEVSYYEYKSGSEPIFPSVNFTNILANMDEDHLYN
jgi:hypothetical protein